MTNLRAFTFFLLLLLTAQAHAGQVLQRAIFEGVIDEQAYLVEFVFRSQDRKHKTWTTIRDFTVRLGEQEILVPKLAFGDLAWTHSPSAPYSGPNSTIRIRLDGGDGEKSYYVVFVFKGGSLVSRELYSKLAKDPEVTQYPSE